MSSSPGDGDDGPDLVCELDCVQGMVDALSTIRWKRHQDAVVEISEHGIVIIVEESGCLQAKVYLKREVPKGTKHFHLLLSSCLCLCPGAFPQLFLVYDYTAEGARPRFGLSLGLLIDCLNTFSSPGSSPLIQICYPGPDMQLLLKSLGSPDACLYAEIRTRIPDTISWDYHFQQARTTPSTFTVKSALLKESIDDLEWPGSVIQISLQPEPPSVIFKGEGHGDLQIEFPYYANTDLLIAFQCDHLVTFRYKYKFLRATTSNFPSSLLRENRGSKVSVGQGGMLKIQHLVSVGKTSARSYGSAAAAGAHQPSRIAYIEFFVKPEEDENEIND